MDYADGSRKFGIYRTMVPYNFPAAKVEEEDQDELTPSENVSADGENIEIAEPDETENSSGDDQAPEEENTSFLDAALQLMKTTYSMKSIMKAALVIFFALDTILVIYLKVLSVRRKRKRKLERAKRERQRIQQHIRATYGE